MTTSKSNTVSLSAKEWVSGDRDLMKTLMKEALQEVLEGEMTEFLGAAPSEVIVPRLFAVTVARQIDPAVLPVPMRDTKRYAPVDVKSML